LVSWIDETIFMKTIHPIPEIIAGPADSIGLSIESIQKPEAFLAPTLLAFEIHTEKSDSIHPPIEIDLQFSGPEKPETIPFNRKP